MPPESTRPTTGKIDITVAAVIESGGRFLLVEEEASGKIVFNQPAGHLEPDEAITDAAIREVFEETGFDFRPDSLLGIYRWSCAEADTTFLRITFCGDAQAPAVAPVLDDGIIAAHWMTLAQISAHEARLRSPMVRRCIDDFIAGTRYPLDVISEIPVDNLTALAGD